ncbi:hypothetical protein [Janthinobacterium fluminis]|uniref:DUF3592 domain-containing protein n=1 Tax=Janthinobacterium fluminis TaxID=2987524 RepID=A0ABT5JV59_9BURK|nr:hypothetical protein [Janthinobacterium fluminis]MDC8756043.1 hypothetical protein [Janthinobacterium fluminis]
MKNEHEKINFKYVMCWVLMFLVIIAAVFLWKGRGSMGNCGRTAAELSIAANSELHVGSGGASVENFLLRKNIKYSYDEFSGRFQGIIRSEENGRSNGCAVVAHVYVDKDMRYIKSEFITSYTGL